MRPSDSAELVRSWVVDYTAATARAIEWLGDRYLLAKPINRRFAQPRDWQRPACAFARSQDRVG